MTASDRRVRIGFALPAVLAVVGVVTLIFLVAITALASLTSEARSARSRVQFIQAALSTEAKIQFLASTEPLRANGFQVGEARETNEYSLPVGDAGGATDALQRNRVLTIRVDGRPYLTTGENSVIVRLQDQAGLINVVALTPEAERRLYAAIGIPEARQSIVSARLIDYMDVDDLTQTNGAEKNAYGIDPPPNRSLRRASELLSVLDVRQAVDGAAWRRVRPNLVTDWRMRAINLNTLTPLAMEIMLGLTPDQAQAIVRARESGPFFSLDAFNAVAGTALVDEGEAPYLFPAGRIVYEISDTRSPWVYRGRITLTPQGIERPLWIDQTEQIEAPRRTLIRPEDAVEFPYSPG